MHGAQSEITVEPLVSRHSKLAPDSPLNDQLGVAPLDVPGEAVIVGEDGAVRSSV